MKAVYKINNRISFEIDAEGQKELFKEISTVQEIFGENVCGMCESEDIRFVVRNVEDNDYYELRCSKCGATLSFGQHKKGNTLFPKRKDDEGKYMSNNGWHKWQPNNQNVSNPKKNK